MRAVERPDAELDPASPLEEMGLEEDVVDVVAGVSLVAGETDGRIYVRGKIGVDLDEAPAASLVPVVRPPRRAGDVRDGERFVVGQFETLLRPPARLRDRGREDGIEPLPRNDEALPEPLDAIEERPLAGRHDRFETGDRLETLRLVVRRRLGVVDGPRLLVE